MENFVVGFHFFTTLIMGINFAWWTSRGLLNLMIKVTFCLGMIMGIIVLLNDFGFIIKG